MDEIEGAEKKAEEILAEARAKASERVSLAKSRSFGNVVTAAKEAAGMTVEAAGEEARSEAKKIRPVFPNPLPQTAEAQLSEELAKSVLLMASKG